MVTPLKKPFLTAEWRDLLFVNYQVDPSLLQKYVPPGTELDLWQGKALISFVAFRFLRTKVLGFSVPFHVNFEEVNLRFYVKRTVGNELRRGVVFIKEFVPRLAIATVARVLYNEKYSSIPMSHTILETDSFRELVYTWKYAGDKFGATCRLHGAAEAFKIGSEAEFILEHYWGYSRNRKDKTIEYEVSHPRWAVWTAPAVSVKGDLTKCYPKFADAFTNSPHSVLFAEGSTVTVFKGVLL